MLLSFQDSTMKGFERHPWTIVEIEAVNIFMKRLPQYHIHSYLKRAFDSITASYGGVSTADIVDPTSSPSLIALEASAETTPSDTQAVTILTDIPRDLQTRQNHHPEPERENSREPSPTGPQDLPRACNQESNSTYPQELKDKQSLAPKHYRIHFDETGVSVAE
ncbi:hypothetical protein N7527_005566 [Penicillium freii]|nr:hypothetical protein N7527_005566 [Penicillium freii]